MSSILKNKKCLVFKSLQNSLLEYLFKSTHDFVFIKKSPSVGCLLGKINWAMLQFLVNFINFTSSLARIRPFFRIFSMFTHRLAATVKTFVRLVKLTGT